MSSGRNMVTVYFTVIGGVILAGLVLFAPWPFWGTLIGGAALVALAVWLTTALKRRSRPPSPPPYEFVDPPPPPPVVEDRRKDIERVPLPSRQADYCFLFSATVVWRARGLHVNEDSVNLAGLAVDAILNRAVRITGERDPDQAPLVQHELGGALATMEPDDRGYVQAMAVSVELTLSAEDQERLDRLAVTRKDNAAWEHLRKYEQIKREYLGQDVLKDTGSAVVWWLARNDDQIQKTVSDIELLTRLASAANNKGFPVDHMTHPSAGNGQEPARDTSQNGMSLIDSYAAFLRAIELETDQRPLFTHQVASLVGNYRPEAAEEILLRFNASPPAPQASDDDVPLPDPPPDDPAY